MKRYIGLDVHAASTTFAVIDARGKRVSGPHVVETNGQALVAFIKTVPGETYVCLEEGTQSAWIYEILSPHATEVVVVAVSNSRGQKSDAKDAFGLAEQLRTGAVKKTVFKKLGPFGPLRELARIHSMMVSDVVRVQGRLKSVYRSRGITTTSKTIYSATGRERWLKRLPAGVRAAVMALYDEYDALVPIRKRAEKQLVTESHNHPISHVLETCPGLGPIRVSQLLPIVVTPWRFRTKRQFWSYCGLGIVMRSSSDWARTPDGDWVRSKVNKTRGLNLNHNHMLKNIFKGAATTKLSNEPLHQNYRRLLTAGTKPNLAKLTMARKIAAITISMWKNGEEYDATKHCKQKT